MREALSDTSLEEAKRTILSPEERRESARRRNREHYYRNLPYYKVRSYKDFDKKKGLSPTLSVEEFNSLLEKYPHCYYCEGTEISTLGLDRVDNSKSHELDNVVICCEKCNNILGDIPFGAKLELKEGLMEIYRKDLLNSWTVPTKRTNERSSK